MLTARGALARRVFVLCVLAAVINVGHASAQSLPAPWNAQGIGNPAIPGRATFDGTRFTVTAAGNDIWGSSDQFHFVYQQVTGDVDVIARVDSVSMAHAWSKSGVMIRSALTANAAHGLALASAGRGVAFQYRAQAGGASASVAGSSAAPPRWVRLVRAGTTVTAYWSADGRTWSIISSTSIALGSVAYVGIATTSHNTAASTTAVVSQVALVPLTLPSPQRAMDIGAPTIKGSVAYRQGAYTVRAGGSDIWSTADQFYFVYQQVSGDVEVVARVRSVSNANAWSKSGVMIRETLTPGSRHASAFASAAKGYAFQRRADTGAFSDSTPGPAGAPPGWVRLVRTGSQIEAFQSADGTTWRSIGTDAIPMTATVYVGIATTSHHTTSATDAVLDNVKVVPIGAAANQPPLVALTAPADGATITAGADASVTAAASESDGTISRVEFYAGAALIGSDATSPYGATWRSVAAGSYSLTAVAVDNDGAKTISATVSVTAVAVANKPPTVTLTAPANGAAFAAPATIALTATASDPENALARVEFYSGTTLLGTDTTAPYSFSWPSVAAGRYTVRAIAYDAAGASASSVASTIAVSATTTTPPRAVVFHASADHATLVTRYELRIFASGANPATATPLATSDLGKPAPDASGDITVDRATFFSTLTVGSYVAGVTAIGSGGSATSTGVTFTR